MDNLYGSSEHVTDEVMLFPVKKDVDNVILKNVEYKTAQNATGDSYEFLLFTYTRDVGEGQTQMLTDRVLPVNSEVILKWDNATQETVDKMFAEFNKRMAHVGKIAGVTKDMIDKNCKAASFKEFATKYAKLVNENNKHDLLYMKVAKNSKGYTSVPTYVPFLQLMSIGDCTLEYSKGEEKIFRNLGTTNGTLTTVETDTMDELTDLGI